MEIWKAIKGYEGIYEISEHGKVRSLNHLIKYSDGRSRIQKGRILKTSLSKKGYVRVSLSKQKKRFHTSIHRLLALSFIDNPENKKQVNHINGIKHDNRIENLEWVSNSENQIHAIKKGLTRYNYNERHHNSKLTNKGVLRVRNLHRLGFTNKELAEDYNVSQTAMSNILRNITYKNI